VKHILLSIAVEDGDVEKLREEFDEFVEGNDKVIGVMTYGTLEERLVAGDKIPGEDGGYGRFADGTVGSLIEALKEVDPTGHRRVENYLGTAETLNHVFVAEDGIVRVNHLDI
jgi:hypothetical protein